MIASGQTNSVGPRRLFRARVATASDPVGLAERRAGRLKYATFVFGPWREDLETDAGGKRELRPAGGDVFAGDTCLDSDFRAGLRGGKDHLDHAVEPWPGRSLDEKTSRREVVDDSVVAIAVHRDLAVEAPSCSELPAFFHAFFHVCHLRPAAPMETALAESRPLLADLSGVSEC